MFSHREAQTKFLILAVVILSLSFLIVTLWEGISLASSSISPSSTQVFVVTMSQIVNPTAVLTPITTGTPNATDIAVVATQQAKFESEHIQYPTLPASNIPGTGSPAASFNWGAWLGILGIIAVLLVLFGLALRAQLKNAKR